MFLHIILDKLDLRSPLRIFLLYNILLHMIHSKQIKRDWEIIVVVSLVVVSKINYSGHYIGG